MYVLVWYKATKPNVLALMLPAIRLQLPPYYGYHLGIDQNMDGIADCYVHDQRVWVHNLPKYFLDDARDSQLLRLAITMLPHSRWSPISPSPKYAPKGH